MLITTWCLLVPCNEVCIVENGFQEMVGFVTAVHMVAYCIYTRNQYITASDILLQ